MRKKQFYTLIDAANEACVSQEEILGEAEYGRIRLFVKPEPNQAVFSCDLKSTNIDDEDLLRWKRHPVRKSAPSKDNIPRREVSVHAVALSAANCRELIETGSCDSVIFFEGVSFRGIPFPEIKKPSVWGAENRSEQWAYCVYLSNKKNFKFDEALGFDAPEKRSISRDDVFLLKDDVDRISYVTDCDGRAFSEAEELVYDLISCWVIEREKSEYDPCADLHKERVLSLLDMLPSRIMDVIAIGIKWWGFSGSEEAISKNGFEKDLRRIRLARGDGNLENYIKGAFQVVSKKYSVRKKPKANKSLVRGSLWERLDEHDQGLFSQTEIKKKSRLEAVIERTSAVDLVRAWCDLCAEYLLGSSTVKPNQDLVDQALFRYGIRPAGKDPYEGVVRWCRPMFALEGLPDK